MQIFYFCSQNPVGQQSGPQGEGGDEVGHVERIFLIYVLKYYPVTRLPDREISLPDCYPVICYPARVLQSLV